MIERTFDVSYINYLINHPTVAPHVLFPDQKYGDVSGLMNDNIFLVDEGCGFVFTPNGELYEGHLFALKNCRGAEVLSKGRAAIRWLFNYGAKGICGYTPIENKAARKFNRLLGFKSLGEREHKTKNEKVMQCEYFQLLKKDYK